MDCSHGFDGLGQHFVFLSSSLMNDLHPCLSVTLLAQPYTRSIHDKKTVSSRLKELFLTSAVSFFSLGQIRFGFGWGIKLPRLKSNYILSLYIPSRLPHLFFFASAFTFLFQFWAQSQVMPTNQAQHSGVIYEIQMNVSLFLGRRGSWRDGAGHNNK